MLSSDIRSRFITFFQERGHTRVASSAIVPYDDPTLLFTNAGMVQFKALFLGQSRTYLRAVSSQKCMRAGGKHNDLEQVGKTARHHTFFEMLGNFSFGDYFKKDAIRYAWELVTDLFQLPKERLWITIYQEDDDAETLWKSYLPKSRIVRLGKKDNFWQMGETGPCGPCSEIMIDQGEAVHADCPGIGQCDCDRYLEIWNLVFMQYNQDAAGLSPLPNPSIDTGMGLERITAVCQGVLTNYETDLFKPLLNALAARTSRTYTETLASMPARVIADHLRAMTFLISDGVLPSNEGRGYVLRRIIRRAARFGKKLNVPLPFLHTLTETVIDSMRPAYPELEQARRRINPIVQREEERFSETLNRGSALIEEIIEEAKKRGKTQVPGEAIFKLYDTYGFPMDMAKEVAEEAGLSMDEVGFHAAMAVQKERARQSWVGILKGPKDSIPDFPDPFYAGATLFTGYERLSEDATLLGILKSKTWVQNASSGEEVDLIFDRTPFYSEGGGQIGDRGTLVSSDAQATITSTRRTAGGICLHHADAVCGTLTVGTRVFLAVDSVTRQHTARNHTATHLLHAVLREILGDHVKQEGSLVAADRLRFDFSHFASLSPKEIDKIEACVNEWILQCAPVNTAVMPINQAIVSGAMALFGEKYGDVVRVVSVSDFSRELCGGTHCQNTGQIGLFKIVREGSVASGVRRIEAITGDFSYQWAKQGSDTLLRVSDIFKTPVDALVGKATQLVAQLKEKEQQIGQLKKNHVVSRDLLLSVQKVGPVSVLVEKMSSSDIKELRLYADHLRDRLKSGIVIVGAESQEAQKASLVVMVTPEWTSRYPASAIAAELAKQIGGTGGGKANMAQAGGKQIDRLDAALAQSVAILQALGDQEGRGHKGV